VRCLLADNEDKKRELSLYMFHLEKGIRATRSDDLQIKIRRWISEISCIAKSRRHCETAIPITAFREEEPQPIRNERIHGRRKA